MSFIKINWIDDSKTFVTTLAKGRLRYAFEERDITLKDTEVNYDDYIDSKDYWSYTYNNQNIVVEYNDYIYDISVLSKWTGNDYENSIFLIDFNLKDHSGDGFNGDEVIKEIRRHNKDCSIIFYSSEASQEELREKIKDFDKVICIGREHMFDSFIQLFYEHLELIKE